MNKVILIGRWTKDPELKFTPGNGTAVCTGTLAVDRKVAGKDGKREADFIPVVIWGKQAEATATHSAKGKLIGIAGRIQVRSYDDKEGNKRYATEVIAEDVQFIEWASAGANGQTGNKPNSDYDDSMTPIDDGDIPF